MSCSDLILTAAAELFILRREETCEARGTAFCRRRTAPASPLCNNDSPRRV